ncbi:MAG: hypothetical protein M3340_01885 [Actinomycetota bacterium]|nr:hypothetical protein [Actinomycetota bacterium]
MRSDIVLPRRRLISTTAYSLPRFERSFTGPFSFTRVDRTRSPRTLREIATVRELPLMQPAAEPAAGFDAGGRPSGLPTGPSRYVSHGTVGTRSTPGSE